MYDELKSNCDTCRFYLRSDSVRCVSHVPGSYAVGQNVFISGTNLTWIEVVHSWEMESTKFNYNTPGNDPNLVSNYVQVS